MIIDRARLFATAAHGATGQLRKYTSDPYIVHPTAVAHIVRKWGGTESMIAAAFLHDVVEDTSIPLETIRAEFGPHIASLVKSLTDVSRPEDGNRAARKAIDRDHIASASGEAQTIKMADLLDNTASITRHDPDFAKVYMREKRALLDVMTKGNRELWAVASNAVDEYFSASDAEEG